MDELRRNGRTTHLLIQCKQVGGIFIVRNDAVRRYVKTLPESKGVDIKTCAEIEAGATRGRHVQVIYDHY